ncbi:MAG: VRR-NUC domain-containing protein [Sphaerochaetaceae bacterium]
MTERDGVLACSAKKVAFRVPLTSTGPKVEVSGGPIKNFALGHFLGEKSPIGDLWNRVPLASTFQILTRLPMREKEIERALATEARRRGGLTIKLVTPTLDGMPDRLVLMPGGHMGFVEVKAPGLKPRALQLSRHRMLRNLGFQVFVLDDKVQIGGLFDAIQTT